MAIVALGLLLDGWVAANGALWYRTADFHCLHEGARLLAAGADPYDPAVWRPVVDARYPDPFGDTAPSSCVARYASPLWTAVAMLPFGILPLEIAAWLWMAVSIGAVILGMRWIWIAVGGSRRLAPVFGVLVIASQPFWLLLVGAQVSGILVGLIGASLVLRTRGHETAAGAMLGALVIKPQVAGVFVPAIVLRDALRGRPRSLVGAAVAVGALTAASIALRPTWMLGWLDELLGRRLGYAGLLPSAWGLANDAFGTTLWAPALIAVAIVATAAIVRPYQLAPVRFAALALSLSLFAVPHVWSYDFLVLAFPWAVALALADRLAGWRRALILFATMTVASLMPWTLFAIGLARGQENWSALVPIASALLVAAAHRLSSGADPIPMRTAVASFAR